MSTTLLPLTLPLLETTSPLQSVADWAVSLMDMLGGFGAGLAIALENLFPPLPSEVILPLAGFAASRGTMSLAEALIGTTAGSVVGAMALYYLGAALGLDRIRGIALKVPLINLKDVDRTHAWFQRHGGKAVFFGRMVPIFRSFISIPAGIERMAVGKFLLLTLAGSAIWNSIFVLSGFFLGENWHIVENYAGVFQKIVIGVVVVAVVVFVARRVHERGESDPDRDELTAAAQRCEPVGSRPARTRGNNT